MLFEVDKTITKAWSTSLGVDCSRLQAWPANGAPYGSDWSVPACQCWVRKHLKVDMPALDIFFTIKQAERDSKVLVMSWYHEHQGFFVFKPMVLYLLEYSFVFWSFLFSRVGISLWGFFFWYLFRLIFWFFFFLPVRLHCPIDGATLLYGTCFAFGLILSSCDLRKRTVSWKTFLILLLFLFFNYLYFLFFFFEIRNMIFVFSLHS